MGSVIGLLLLVVVGVLYLGFQLLIWLDITKDKLEAKFEGPKGDAARQRLEVYERMRNARKRRNSRKAK